MITKYVLAWIPMVFLAIANGLLREFTYGKAVSELRAHQISTLTAILLIGTYVAFLSRRWRLESTSLAWIVGVLWLVMTVCFELLFGHYVAGHSWSRLWHDYDLTAGRIWSIFLLFVALSPWIFRTLGSKSYR